MSKTEFADILALFLEEKPTSSTSFTNEISQEWLLSIAKPQLKSTAKSKSPYPQKTVKNKELPPPPYLLLKDLTAEEHLAWTQLCSAHLIAKIDKAQNTHEDRLTLPELKQRFRSLAKALHPDMLGTNPRNVALLIKCQAGYKLLRLAFKKSMRDNLNQVAA